MVRNLAGRVFGSVVHAGPAPVKKKQPNTLTHADWRAVACSGQLGAQREQDDHQGGRTRAGMMLPRFLGTLVHMRFESLGGRLQSTLVRIGFGVFHAWFLYLGKI